MKVGAMELDGLIHFAPRLPRLPLTNRTGSRWRSKLIESASAPTGRAVKSAHLVALVRAGAKFENGVLVERRDESTSGDTHAA
jgi:hypothetical protein